MGAYTPTGLDLTAFTDQNLLTQRELQVLVYGGAGFTASQTGGHLSLTENTVKTFQKRAFNRLGARSLAHALTIGHELGVLPMHCRKSTPAPTLAMDNRVDRFARPRDYVDDPRVAGHAKPRKPAPAGLAKTYPSVAWGEQEWFVALQDDELYFSLLEAMARLTTRQAP